jgi:hypothetical protein
MTEIYDSWSIAEYCNIQYFDENANKIKSIMIKDVKPDMLVILSDGLYCKIKAILKSYFNGKLTVVNNLNITPYYPIKINNSWVYPANISNNTINYSGNIYSLLLEETTDKCILIEDIQCSTCGNDNILTHPYFSNYSNFKSFSGLCNVRFRKNPISNLINGIERMFHSKI